MKKLILVLLAVVLCVTFAACGPRDYVLNENTFFLVMTNIQYYPEQYLQSNIEFDCFTYELVDVDGNSYMCGVRKCSAGYGCTCGNDTIIGFVLEYDGELPQPRNQSENTNDKTWVHLSGKVKSADKLKIEIRSYLSDGSIDPTKTEQIEFLMFVVDSLELIEDYSNLAYYVTD
ncbi:MAG: hypothetical protein J1F66_01195 [Clostridiales bacterium]|nr:hypothetical protein [Clostridiales bacterium]